MTGHLLWFPSHMPTPATLKKYGLTFTEWLQIYNAQEGKCGICHRTFAGIRANIDHVHVKGWKKMTPEQKRPHIRGLLCYNCNKFMVMRGVTAEKLYEGWQYMRRHETRITAENLVREGNTRKKRTQG